MKTNRIPLWLSLIFSLGILSYSYGADPKDVIDRIFNNMQLNPKLWGNTGNVLAYQNKFNQTIVLTSGSFFGNHTVVCIKMEHEPELTDVIIIPLEDIISLITNQETLSKNTYTIDIENKRLVQNIKTIKEFLSKYLGCCEKDNDSYRENAEINECNAGKLSKAVTDVNDAIMLYLNDYRHTEIQVQALLNASQEGTNSNKVILEALLPAILFPVKERKIKGINVKIYSLFEACQACEKTAWLQIKMTDGTPMKDYFCFKVLDNQYTKAGKRNVINEKGDSCYMTQTNLESMVDGDFKKFAQDKSPRIYGLLKAVFENPDEFKVKPGSIFEPFLNSLIGEIKKSFQPL